MFTLFNNRLFTTPWFKMTKQHVGLSFVQQNLPEIQPAAAEALPLYRQLRWHLLCSRLASQLFGGDLCEGVMLLIAVSCLLCLRGAVRFALQEV